MADQGDSHDALVAQFIQVTGSQPSEALEYLTAHDFNIQTALADFFSEAPSAEADRMDSDYSDDEPVSSTPQPIPTSSTPSHGGGRRLGDGTENTPPVVASSSSQPRASTTGHQSKQRKKFATLGDISSSGHEGHGHADDDSDDDDNKQDLFAGGEKSGLAVQNPDDIKKKILEKARRSAQKRPQDIPAPRPSHFTGSARTLGGDDTPSQVIENQQPAQAPQRPPRVERVLHFWTDGWSIDDGDLYPDNPRNRQILEGIRQGNAPLSVMNVLPGQDVDVEIQQHDTPFVKPKRKYKPFESQGQRLGSPTPGFASSSTAPPAPPAATSSSASTASEPPKVDVDTSQPTVTLQIRLGDGSRLTSRFNTTHTIGDVYSFVAAANPASSGRPWVLMTTFPNKELTDKSAILGELSDFKRGGVVVQKWS